MFCQNCGNRIENDSVFCNICGTKVDPMNEGGTANATKSTSAQAEENVPVTPAVFSLKLIWEIVSWVIKALVVILILMGLSYQLDPHHNLLGYREARRMYSAAQEAIENEIYEELGDVKLKFAPYKDTDISNRTEDVVFEGIEYSTMGFMSYVEIDGERFDYQIIIGFSEKDVEESEKWYYRKFVGFADLLNIRLNSNTFDFYYEIISFE